MFKTCKSGYTICKKRETTGYDDSCRAVGFHCGGERCSARIEPNSLFETVLKITKGQALQQSNPFDQRLFKIEFTAHRALGNS